jgi:hypothetical protein
MFDASPRSVLRASWRWSGIAAIALVLLAALIIGGWQAGWWFAGQDATRQAHLIQNGVSNQESQEAQLTANIASVLSITAQMTQASGQQLADLHAQRLGIAAVACQNAAQVTAVPPDQAGWVSQNCEDGTVSPASPLEK